MAKIYILLVALTILSGCRSQHISQDITIEERKFTDEDSIISQANVYETAYTGFGMEEPISGTDTIKHYVKLELITKAFFDQKRKTAVDYLTHDTQIKKKDSVLVLPCRDSIIILTDHEVDDETRHTHEYVGSIPFLNQYVVSGAYWEDRDVQLLDKTTGKLTATLSEYPFISPDKKFILDVTANIYDTAADLHIFRITKSGIGQALYTTFKNWMPEITLAFYSKDGSFYTPVKHPKRFWDKTGNYSIDYQHLKITILEKNIPKVITPIPY